MTSLKETIKSIMLVSLVIAAVVLSRLVLLDGQTRVLETVNVIETSSVNVAKYINPQSYYVSFGGLSYTKVYDTEMQQKIWDALRPIVTDGLVNYEGVEVIEMTDYIEAFADKSILLRFTIDLNCAEWLPLYDSEIEVPSAVSKWVPYEILMRSDLPNSLFVYDRDEEAYYRVAIKGTEAENSVSELVDTMMASDFVEYRKISDRFSLASTVPDSLSRYNYELLPYQYTHLTQGVKVMNEVSTDAEAFDASVASIANEVFGNRLDFVKRLEDVNGSIVLMYGYGDKALTVAQNGDIIMNQKFNSSLAHEMGFRQSLAIGIGGMEQFGELPQGVQLDSVVTVDEDYTKYRFNFSYKLDDTVVSAQSGGIQVTVKGGQVIAIEKNVKQMMSRVYTSLDQMYSIDNCITQNYLEVSLYYLQDNDIYDATLNSIQYYFPIRSDIERIERQYYQQDMTMIPIWRVVISGRTYLFNAYTGALIENYR
ncbi:hypothetical protein KHM83_10980 [Fusibacter paucivorans]|uniref:Regulatory protein YycH domain-containing protein n=1 Tax=Fusibacter paucivorans TaxID=76009 RepID=A0ABS5PPV2_9FIRM|nr:hypothetical protein [Fusibacter paucivorans]MBS7527204.1 hypothetical protein [Fusibacter paucivorans]